MRLIFIALLFPVLSFGQKDSTLTDSTALLSLKDVQKISSFLEDKLIAKDYNLVMRTLEAILSEAIQRKKK